MSEAEDNPQDLETEIDRLYQRALTEFVDSRNQLASSLRKRDREAAARVRRLPKPSVSAWAVNQAYWNAREEFNALIDAGEELRASQRKALSGEQAGDMQSAMSARLQAIAAVQKHAEEALEHAGHGTNNTISRRITTTLEALAAYGRADSAPPAGRLSIDVPSPGFDALAKLAGETPGARENQRKTTASIRRAKAKTKSRRGDRSKSANDNEPGRIIEVLARQAQKRALDSVTDAQAKIDAGKRALDEAEKAESEALEHMYETKKQVTMAQERLSMAITAHTDAERAVDQAKEASEKAKGAMEKAEKTLAEAQERIKT